MGSLAAFLLVGSTLAAVPPGVLIDRVVVVVNQEVVTHSELLTEARILFARRVGGAASSMQLDDCALGAVRDSVIIQLLVAGEAQRWGAAQLSEQRVDKAFDEFADGFRTQDAYRAFMRRFDIEESTLRSVIRRDLRNELYLQERLKQTRFRNTEDPRAQAEALISFLSDLVSKAEIHIVDEKEGRLELQRDWRPGTMKRDPASECAQR